MNVVDVFNSLRLQQDSKEPSPDQPALHLCRQLQVTWCPGGGLSRKVVMSAKYPDSVSTLESCS
jgi:hypothetical protein